MEEGGRFLISGLGQRVYFVIKIHKEKKIVIQVQEVWRVPYRINSRRNTPGHLLIKLKKIKQKKRILKAAREKKQVTYKGNTLRLTADLSAETLQAKRECRIYLKYWKGKIYNQDCCTWQGSHKIDGEIKSFSDKQKLREFSTTKLALQQMLKGLYSQK